MQPEYKKLLSGLPVDGVDDTHRHGLTLKPGLDVETWSHLMSGVVNLTGRATQGRDTLTAWLGDLLAYGEGKYKGQISEYAKASGLNAGTLRWTKLVASRIPVLCRHNTLTWSHHCEMGRAFDNLDEIKKWIQLAVNERWSTKELRQRIRLHLKEPQNTPPVDNAAEGASFFLLRELRTAGRTLSAQRKNWKEWSPETCGLALGEIKALSDFIDYLRTQSTLTVVS